MRAVGGVASGLGIQACAYINFLSHSVCANKSSVGCCVVCVFSSYNPICSDSTVQVTDARTGEVTCTLSEHSSRIWSLHSNTANQLCSASADGTVKVVLFDVV